MSKVIWGTKIIRLPQVNSTNQFAKELSSYIKPVFEGTTVLAEEQLGGKGRKEKEWVSEKNKNLCFSVILFPKFLDSKDLFLLSKAVSLGIWDYLNRQNLINAKIKWPNDLYVGDKKIAGILIENTWKGQELQETVVGVGLNVNQTNFPTHLPNPTSLRLVKNREFNVDEVLKDVFECLDKRYMQLKDKAFDQVNQDYRNHLYGLNELKTYDVGGIPVNGKVRGVDEDGKLKLTTQEGDEQVFDLDQISLWSGSLPTS
jgi:BirA family biotin operon repressor/biotin-[acetyl-CoA-carboxylase] ligase